MLAMFCLRIFGSHQVAYFITSDNFDKEFDNLFLDIDI